MTAEERECHVADALISEQSNQSHQSFRLLIRKRAKLFFADSRASEHTSPSSSSLPVLSVCPPFACHACMSLLLATVGAVCRHSDLEQEVRGVQWSPSDADFGLVFRIVRTPDLCSRRQFFPGDQTRRRRRRFCVTVVHVYLSGEKMSLSSSLEPSEQPLALALSVVSGPRVSYACLTGETEETVLHQTLIWSRI